MNILGIDIGGTSIKYALVETSSGKLLGEVMRMPTPKPCTQEALLVALSAIISASGHRGPVGVGFPGIVRSGVIAAASNLDPDLIGVRLVDKLKARTGLYQVTLVNDADAAGLAIAAYDKSEIAPGLTLVLTLGTGIGGALVHGGHLVPNLEPGQIHIPNPLGATGERIRAEKLLSAINREKLGLSWERWAGLFNEYLEELHMLLQPELIILGGGGAHNAQHFLHLLKAPCPIHIAQLGNDAGVIGAALSAKHL